MYETLLLMLQQHKWTRQPKSGCVAKFRKKQQTCNIGYTVKFNEPGQPIAPSAHMMRDEFKMYNECKRLFPDFQFESIQINKNFQCPRHKDGKNVGKSLLMGLGDYTGGETGVCGLKSEGIEELYDIRYKPIIFDGSKHEHWVEPYEGDRYSIVLFNL